MAVRSLPSQEDLRNRFDYDPETGVLRWKNRPRDHFTQHANFVRWNIYLAGKIAGVIRKKSPYRQVNMDGRSIMAHRIIWRWMTGDEPSKLDHRNLIKSDNRWENLRPASDSENSQNRRGQPRRKFGTLKGASWNSRERVWRAFVMANGVSVYLGRFSTEEEAHDRYCEEAAKLHGEFANFESGVPQ